MTLLTATNAGAVAPAADTGADNGVDVGTAPPHRGAAWVGTLSNILAVVAMLVVLFAGYLFGASRLIEARHQHQLAVELTHGTGLSAYAGRLPANGQAVAVLTIPALGLKDFVVEGTSSADLQRGPGLLEGSAPPGTGGDTVIEGRRSTFGAPFSRLPSLRKGDSVEVVSALGRFTYTVSALQSLAPGSEDPIGVARSGELTLVTSSPSLLPTHAIAVQATLQGHPVATDAVVPPPQATLGLAGDPAGRFGVLVSAELLIALAIGVVVLRRRWSRGKRLPGMTWVLIAPVTVALLLLLFEQTARLLPATM